MGLHDQLGPARRAGRGDQYREVAGADRAAGPSPAAASPRPVHRGPATGRLAAGWAPRAGVSPVTGQFAGVQHSPWQQASHSRLGDQPGQARSVTSARGRVCWARPASSAGALRGLTDTTTAPSAVTASQQIRYSGVVRAVTMTRSPGPMPAPRRPRAAAATWRSAPAKLSVPSSVRTQMPSGSRAAASARTCGMVRLARARVRLPGRAQDDPGVTCSRQECCGTKPSAARPGQWPAACRTPPPRGSA